MLDQGADPNPRNSQGESPLHMAAAMSFPKAVTLLLDHRAGVNARDDRGRTPLITMMTRAVEPDAQVGTLLLDWGADVNARDEVGVTALYYAEQQRAAAEVIRILKDHGATDGAQIPTASPTPTPRGDPDAAAA